MNANDALIAHLKKSGSAVLPRAHAEGRLVHVRLVMPDGRISLSVKTPGDARLEAALLRLLVSQLEAAADRADAVAALDCEGSA